MQLERGGRRAMLAGLAAVAALGLSACAGVTSGGPGQQPGPSVLVARSPAPSRPSLADPGAPASGVTLSLVAQQPSGKDVGWDVWGLTAPAGRTFEIAYRNTDDARHDFAVVPVGGILKQVIWKSDGFVKPSESAVITVPGLPAGTYDYICTLHSVEMRGKLTVE